MSYLWTSTAANARLPYVQFTGMSDDESPSGFVLIDRDPNDDGQTRTPIPIGTLVVIDWGSFKVGPLLISKLGVDSSYLRYFGQPSSPPPPSAEYKDGFSLTLIFQGYGVRSYSANGIISCNAMRDLQHAFARATEGQAGKLCVYVVCKSKGFYSAPRATTFFAPVLRLQGWIDRPGIFGPRHVEPPKPIDFNKVLTGPPPKAAALSDDDVFRGLQSATPAPVSPIPDPSPIEGDEVRF